MKNARLGFAIPYVHNGRGHDYQPDFIVRLAGDERAHLIIETKGFDDLADVKAAAAALDRRGECRRPVWEVAVCHGTFRSCGPGDSRRVALTILSRLLPLLL